MRWSRLSRSVMSPLVAAMVLAAGLVVVTGGRPASAATTESTCAPGALVGVSTATSVLSRWVDPDPRTAGGFVAAAPVGTGFGSFRLLASDAADGRLYGITTSGAMYVYPWNGTTGRYTAGARIGSGWESVTALLPMGNGVFYAVFPNGEMRWYMYLPGSATWHADSGTRIATGWDAFSTIASGGGGVLYATERSTGLLYWYQRTFPFSVSGTWARAVVGSGFGPFNRLVGGGDGVIYATRPDGTMAWFNHTGSKSGARTWAPGSGTKVGTGWGGVRALTADPNSCRPSGPVTYAMLTGMFGARVPSSSQVEPGLSSLNAEMLVGSVTTPARMAAFLATLLNESSLRHDALQGGNPACSTACGRGYIQLTGTWNYSAAGDYFLIPLVSTPELARALENSARIARWYWTVARPTTNSAADALNLGQVALNIGFAGSGDPNNPERLERCADFKSAYRYLTGATPAITC